MTREFRPTPVPRPGSNARAGQSSPLEEAARLEVFGGDGLHLQEEADRALGTGYDPYDTYPPVRQSQSTQKHSDLRRLSEAIRARRAAEQAALEATGDGPPPRGLKRLLRSLR